MASGGAPVRLTAAQVRRWISPRKPDSHKGTFGHVLVVAGSRGLAGAAVLSASGALRAGAGLVTAAVPQSQQPIVARRIRPEAMTLAAPESSAGTFSPRAAAFLAQWMRKRRVTALALGPGLSRDAGTARFVRELLKRAPSAAKLRAAVADADAFLALSAVSPARFPKLPLIVTPHPGEIAFFSGISVESAQKDRARFAREFAKLYRVVCVLKGHRTIVSDGHQTFENTTGNPGMATGGSGDVLTGVIAALAAQTDSPLHAAAAGVFVHGLAGDLAAREKGQVSLLAGDIAEHLPQAFKSILKK